MFQCRLVLPRLMTLLEKTVIDDMYKTLENGGDVCEEALKILQPCQVIYNASFYSIQTDLSFSQIHNADQLSEWCLAYLAQNYITVCRRLIIV